MLRCLSVLVIFLLAYNLLTYLADKGFVKTAILLAAIFVISCTGINFFFHWIEFPAQRNDIPVLKLSSIHSPVLSVGDIALLIVFKTWFATFIYSNRKRILQDNLKPLRGYILFIVMVAVLISLSHVFSNLFCNLIVDSNIQFDIDNLLNLTQYNFLGAIMLCLSYLIFYLVAETFISISNKILISDIQKLAVFTILIISASFVFPGSTGWFTWFFILWGVVVAWRAYNVYYQQGFMPAYALVIILGISAAIATIKLTIIQNKRELTERQSLAKRLTNNVDQEAESLFPLIEEDIIKDQNLIRYFSNPGKNESYLKSYLQNMYFDDYLSKYNISMFIYDHDGKNIYNQQDNNLNNYQISKDLGNFPVAQTKDFYRYANSFGERSYFALIPIISHSDSLGTLAIELKSKLLETDNSFLPLLANSNSNPQQDFKNYSFAFYIDNHLVNQSGKYEYGYNNTVFKSKIDGFNTVETDHRGYSHLVYMPNTRKIVVVSLEDKSFSDVLSVFIFFFVIFFTFTMLVIAFYWLWRHMKNLNFNHFIWSLRVAANSLLYKTRIQISMIGIAIFTLLAIGAVTLITFNQQDKKQQIAENHEKIRRIADDYESQMIGNNIDDQQDKELKFNDFAKNYSVDLTLFDTLGVPLLDTRPKLYNTGIISRRMNASAFLEMKRLQKSEFMNDENIGNFKFKSAYVPIHNGQNKVVNYLQLPYFSNEADYEARVGYFVNSMINAYALVLVTIGLFAVIVAKQITLPLNLIQQGLSNTMYGRKTEPINWKRNDEIGSLIREYNKMIASLELSASKLAKSERENAWREMAKQVAHEIKNPLTPLKLGLQLLSKAWRDQDPKFDQKFQRFSTSFIEQIESLTRIATEFSDFARLPDTKPEVVNIFEVISRAVNVFSQSDNIRIDYKPSAELYLIRADKDQLLRCFNNLLKNAIEAIPATQQGIISITYVIDNDSIIVDFSDNGNGIPENLRSNIFQPNFTTKSSGTGLGLAFIKNAIENTGGKVWFESEIGQGTTFHLLFRSASVPVLV